MSKSLKIRAILNKANGQINLSLPKKKLGKKGDKIGRYCRIKFEGFYD